MSPIDPVDFGRQQARLDAIEQRLMGLEGTVFGVDKKVETIIVTLAEKRGERRVATAVAGFGGSLLGLLFGWLAK